MTRASANFDFKDLNLSGILDLVEVAVRYRVQKKLHDCENLIFAKRAEIRQAEFRSSVQTQQAATIALCRLKMRLDILKKSMHNQDERLKELWEPIFKDIEDRIAELRVKRSERA